MDEGDRWAKRNDEMYYYRWAYRCRRDVSRSNNGWAAVRSPCGRIMTYIGYNDVRWHNDRSIDESCCCCCWWRRHSDEDDDDAAAVAPRHHRTVVWLMDDAGIAVDVLPSRFILLTVTSTSTITLRYTTVSNISTRVWVSERNLHLKSSITWKSLSVWMKISVSSCITL